MTRTHVHATLTEIKVDKKHSTIFQKVNAPMNAINKWMTNAKERMKTFCNNEKPEPLTFCKLPWTVEDNNVKA